MVPDAGYIKRNVRRRAATAAGGRPELRDHKRISELGGIDRNYSVSADHWLAAFVLVRCEVHTGREKHPKRALYALALNQTFHISVFTSRLMEEREVRARAVREDCVPHEIEEVVFSLFEPPTEDHSALGDCERIAEIGREPADQPKSHDNVIPE